MSEEKNKNSDVAFSVNILVKKENDLFVAHCLELDIVATGKTIAEAQNEIISLISAQIEYAFANNNLEHLYHPAPPEIWNEFFSCKKQTESKYKIESGLLKADKKHNTLPPWLIAKTCQSGSSCNA
ncbi:type II toxin-antitoxin system HicB family antitoxin [Desulfobacterium sp. N47]|uniref:HicB-like antitoxin of toxin-antitoxin system domain-containing protein n=1 Tax=uncultured Desulfobacterium sp. TaxID=201089 RepID=E1Y878_9BACT|nr:unknown protein [uncultured Desulfobacterium sp.]